MRVAFALGLLVAQQVVSADVIEVEGLHLEVTLADLGEYTYDIVLENRNAATWLGVSIGSSENMLGSRTYIGYWPDGEVAFEPILREGILDSKNTAGAMADNLIDFDGATSVENVQFETLDSSSKLSFRCSGLAGERFTSEQFSHILVAAGSDRSLGYHPKREAIPRSAIRAFDVLPSLSPQEPTIAPTASPFVRDPGGDFVTFVPTPSPTEPERAEQSSGPTMSPTRSPTSSPTALPTTSPTSLPTTSPTALPTSSPTALPTTSPTALPTTSPTALPTTSPTALPTTSPTALPTSSPTKSQMPTLTSSPTTSPSYLPTTSPTKLNVTPSESPTEAVPTPRPTYSPEIFEEYETRPPQPSTSPTVAPTTAQADTDEIGSGRGGEIGLTDSPVEDPDKSVANRDQLCVGVLALIVGVQIVLLS